MRTPHIDTKGLSVAMPFLALLLFGGCDSHLAPTTERDTVQDQCVELDACDGHQDDTLPSVDASDVPLAEELPDQDDTTPLEDSSDVPPAQDLTEGDVLNTCPVAIGGLRYLYGAVDVNEAPTHMDVEFGPVELLGGRSYDEDGDSIAEYRWGVTQYPGRVPPSIGLLSASSGAIGLEIYMAGSYELELTVVDEHGLASCTPSRVTLESTTTAAVVVELTWQTPSDPDESDDDGNDVDLHMLRPGGLVWNRQGFPMDCFFANRSPDWGVQGVTSDNPWYRVDDVDGAGPEVITIQQPALTTTEEGYLIGVFFNDPKHFSPVFPTVKVYSSEGTVEIVGEKGGVALQPREFWIAGELFWTENGPLFVTSDVPQITDGFPSP
ncbi:MAG: hypothetical protein CO108_25955 [Deltaproteobacteria bacterium CG_4_9_14_3_um_filter_63_12]|nr:MAG: hypothetical protein CO108_25955 [Deltaproteobacteria bacterium CG_4_9_14_3_um_filter_63_12]